MSTKTCVLGFSTRVVIFLLSFFQLFHSTLFLNKQIPNQHLKKNEEFEYSVPSDTFISSDNFTLFMSISSNDWVTYNTIREPRIESSYYYMSAQNVFVVDDICYVADNNFGLWIAKCDQSSFVILGNLELYGFSDIGNGAERVIVEGDYAFVADGYGGSVKVINVQNKFNPFLVSELDNGISYDLALEGNYLYVANKIDFFIIDVTVKEDPFYVGSCSTKDAKGLAYRDNLVYIADGSVGLKIINVTNKTHPSIIGIVDTSLALGVALLDDIAFIADGSYGIRSINISDPYDPKSINSLTYSSEYARDVKVLDKNHIVVADSGDNIHKSLLVINVEDKLDPQIVADLSFMPYLPNSHNGFTVFVSNKIVYLSEGEHGFVKVNLTDPTNPIVISNSTEQLGHGVLSLELKGSLLYVGDEFGIIVLDVQNRDKIVRVVDKQFDGNVRDLFLSPDDTYLYVCEYSDSFQRFVILRQDTLEEIGSLNAVKPLKVFVKDEFAFVGNSLGFLVVNITNKTNPYVVHEESLGWVSGIAIENDLLLITSSSLLALYVYDVYIPSSPSFLGSMYFVEGAMGVAVPGDGYAYIANDDEGLKIVDLSDPSSPLLVSSLDTYAAVDVFVQDSFVFVSNQGYNGGSVSIVDISSRETPKLVQDIYLPYGVNKVVARNNMLFVARGGLGVSSLHLDLDLIGKPNKFNYFCGETTVYLTATDSKNERTSLSFTLEREDYCNTRGTCLPNHSCRCQMDYQGDSCESWRCDAVDFFELGKVCNGHGDCISPETCKCRGGYVGENCKQNILYATVMAPILSLTGITIFFCLILSCCLICLVITYSFILFILCLFGLTGVVIKQTRGLRRFSKLKNFDLLLKEQELDEDVNVAHLRINKELFSVDYDEIKLISILGEGGSSSTVYKASWNGKIVAFKSFRTRTVCSSQNSFDEFEREVGILGSVNHPNILQFFGCIMKPPRVGILMEFCGNGDLEYFLRKESKRNNESVPFGVKLRICHEIVLAMSYLHSRSIIHRDLKLENVLLDDSYNCKLMDFGLSRIVDRMSQVKTTNLGTSYYMAPELLGGDYNEKVDVFAFGMCVYVIMTEKYHPYGLEAYKIEIRVANDPQFRPDLSKLSDYVPKEHNEWIEEIISRSWNHESQERSSFSELSQLFKDELKKNKSGESSSSWKLLKERKENNDNNNNSNNMKDSYNDKETKRMVMEKKEELKEFFEQNNISLELIDSLWEIIEK